MLRLTYLRALLECRHPALPRWCCEQSVGEQRMAMTDTAGAISLDEIDIHSADVRVRGRTIAEVGPHLASDTSTSRRR